MLWSAQRVLPVHTDTVVHRASHTVKPHDVLQRGQVLHGSLVTAEDLGSGTEVVGEVLAVLLPHFSITTQGINVWVERHVVGRPVTCRTREEERDRVRREAGGRKGGRGCHLCAEPESGRSIPPNRGSAPPRSGRHRLRCDPA